MSFGSKKGADNAEADPKAFQKNEDRILAGVELLVEFLGKNPYEIIEWGRKAQADSKTMAEAINKMDEFLSWLQKKVNRKGETIPKPTAIVIRGNAMSLFKWNGIRIPTKNGDTISEKKIRDQNLGIDNGDKKKILKDMSYRADPEMKAFLNAGLACGHRISDMVLLEKATLEKMLSKDKEFVIYRAIDKKENALIKAVFGRAQQAHLKAFLASKESKALGDDRAYLFGDSESTDARLREKMETLLHQVYDGADNIITPHTLRSMCETILINKKFVKTQVYQFTGHKNGEKYIELTDEQMIEMFQAAEKDFNLDDTNISMKTEQEIEENLMKKLLALVNNKGKTDTLAHDFTLISDGAKPAETDADKAIEMHMASFLTQLEDAIADRIITRLGTAPIKVSKK